MIPRFTRFILTHKWIAYSLGLAILILGALSNPFQPWTSSLLPSAGIQLSAIPDLGENQQIISTAWPGHSAKEVETYLSAPLSAALMGSSGVTNIRSSSMEGLSLIYLHFEEEVSTQDARQEITQQLFSLQANTLPPDVSPSLGPVSTPLGLIYAYTLEGVDKHGKPAAGWDLHDIRNYHDQYLKPELESISGVAEIAGVGGYQGEYQVILDPRKAHLYQVSISDILQSLNTAGKEVSLGEIAGNGIRYSLSFNGNFTEASELAKLPLLSKHGLSLELGQVATVKLGPARRRGALDHAGREVVGGMIYMQEGEQAMSVISAIEDKINQLTSSLPQQRLANGESVYLTILPYYDVSTLILEVLGTLSHTLLLEVIISFLVILLALRSMKLSLTVSLLLPVSILSCF
ncbi:MAG: efflux RND transporter permease subunit, partial [Bacteroidota bacterium]